MKRAAVFAHYDKDSIIDDYVIYYLHELKKIVDTLVFVSCSDLSESEILKVSGIASHVIAEVHDEYDFGSYKRGFFYLKDKLNEYDELIFANDSCYGPLYPLEEVFSKMELQGCDFWGITKNRFGRFKKGNNKYVVKKRPHIQSYFLVFSKKVFISNVFYEFMNSITHMSDKNEVIINYEIGLSEKLINAGFSCNSYINALYGFNQVLISFWRLLIHNYKMPFVKCSILRHQNDDLTTTAMWEEFISSNTTYPVYLIENNLKRTSLNFKTFKFIPPYIKIFYFYLIGVLPNLPKHFFQIINQKLLR